MYEVAYRATAGSSLTAMAVELCAEERFPPDVREHLSFAVKHGVFTAKALGALRARFSQSGHGNFISSALKADKVKPEIVKTSTLGEDSASAASTAAQREAWRSEMRSRSSHREYSDMVRNVSGATPSGSLGGEGIGASFRYQVGLAGGLLLTLLSAVALGYYGGLMLFGPNSSAPLILAVACGMIMLLVEGALLVIRLSKVDAMEAQASLGRATHGGRSKAGLPRLPAIA